MFNKDIDITSKGGRERYGARVGIIGIVTNAVLAVAKIVLGIVSGSLAILADGVNNMADAASSVITIVGFKIAAKPGDEEHPFGHARSEYIAGLIISIIIIIFGVQLIQSAIGKIIKPESPEFSFISIVILVVAIAAKAWQSIFYKRAGEKIKSATLKAASIDSRNDVFGSVSVLLGVLANMYLGWRIDGLLGALVGLLILWSGISLIKETISPLLGMAPDAELVEKIKKCALSHEGIIGMHDLMVHDYGQSQVFATVHLEVCSKSDLVKSHDLVDHIEGEIGQLLGINLVIHIDPVEVE